MKIYYDVYLWHKVHKENGGLVAKIFAKTAKQAQKQAEKLYPDYFVDDHKISELLTYKDLLEILSSMTQKQLESKIVIMDDETNNEYIFPTVLLDVKNNPTIFVITS